MAIVEDVVREYLEYENFVSTVCDDLCEKVGRATGLNLVKDYKKIQNRIRYVLNKMLKNGELVKITTGTEYCGKTDFGFTHFTQYIKSDYAKLHRLWIK